MAQGYTEYLEAVKLATDASSYQMERVEKILASHNAEVVQDDKVGLAVMVISQSEPDTYYLVPVEGECTCRCRRESHKTCVHEVVRDVLYLKQTVEGRKVAPINLHYKATQIASKHKISHRQAVEMVTDPFAALF